MKRRLPPLLALRAFDAAGRHLSFSKAADELNVTQGAISRQIKLLEDFMCAPLFRRMTRKVELTPFGLNYLEATRAAFNDIESATIQSLQECHSMTISVLPSIGTLWLLQRLASFMIGYPEIRLHVSTSLEPVDFDRDGVDLAIRVGKLPGAIYNSDGAQIEFKMVTKWEGIATAHLWDDFITPVCSQRFLQKNGPLSIERLKHLPLIHNMSRPDCWPAWIQANGHETFETGKRIDVSHSFMAVMAAREDRGIACVPTIEIDGLDWRDEMVQPFDLRLRSAGAYYLLCPRKKSLSPEIKLFSNWLSSLSAIADGPGPVTEPACAPSPLER